MIGTISAISVNGVRRLAIAAVLAVALAGCGGRWIVEGCVGSTAVTLNEHQIADEALQNLAGAFDTSPCRTVLLNHDENRPIGWLRGLRYKGEHLYVTIEVSRLCPDVWRLVRAGLLTGLSLNLYVIDAEPAYFEELDADGWRVLSVRLIEISICSLPADPQARIERWYVE